MYPPIEMGGAGGHHVAYLDEFRCPTRGCPVEGSHQRDSYNEKLGLLQIFLGWDHLNVFYLPWCFYFMH
jgi:hypothetical protein